MNNKTLSKLIGSILISSTLTLFIFFFTPSEIYFNNYRDFNYIYSDIFIWLILLCLLLIFLAAFSISRVPVQSARFISSLILAILILCWIEGYLIYPDFGPIDGRTIDWDKWNTWGYIDTLLWTSIIISFGYLNNIIFKYIKTVCLIIVFALTVSFFHNYTKYSPEQYSKFQFDYKYIPNFSQKQNVIVILLDEIQSDIFYELLNDNDIIKNVFSGFTYYPDTVSGYAWTVPSIPLILTGKYYDNSQPFTGKYLEISYLESSITKKLIDLGYRVELFPKFVDKNYYKSKEIAHNVIRKEEILNFDQVLHNTIGLISLALFKVSPHVTREYIYNNHIFPISNTNKRFTWSHIDYWSQDIHFVENIEKNSRVVYKNPVFKLFHLRGAHTPWIYDANGNIVIPTGSRKNYKEHVLHTLKLVNDILKKFYELGIYDNSLIYVLSDHGAGRSFGTKFNSEIKYNNISNTSYLKNSLIPYQIKARAIPLFMKKPFNSKGQLNISDKPITTSEFNRIVEDDLELNSYMSTKESDDIKFRKYYYYSVSPMLPSGYLPDMFEYIIRGNSWLDSSWEGPNKIYSNNGKIYNRILSLELNSDTNCLNNSEKRIENESYDFSQVQENEYLLNLKEKISNQIILAVFQNFTVETGSDIVISVNGNKIGSIESENMAYKINKPYKLIYLNEENIHFDDSISIKFNIINAHNACLNTSISSLHIFELE